MSRFAPALLLLLFVPALRADDVWIAYGSAATAAGPCRAIRWQLDAAFHNRSDTDAAVRLLHVSNGGDVSAPAQDTVRAGGTLSASKSPVRGTANAQMWMAHLDVPPAIAVEGRLDLFNVDTCATGHPPAPLPAGKIAVPVFKALVPAGKAQAHYGVDLGAQNVRMNVAIYNAGSAPATATLELHTPACPDTPIRTAATIPPDTLLQVPMPRPVACSTQATDPQTNEWVQYVIVTVDQPSVSFVSTLSNEASPIATAAVSGD